MYVFTQDDSTVLNLNRVESFSLRSDRDDYYVSAKTMSGESYTMCRYQDKHDAECALFWLIESWKRRDDDRTVNIGEDYQTADEDPAADALRDADKYII